MKLILKIVSGLLLVTLLISSFGCMYIAIHKGNFKNQDFYGKVIDQYGQPVAAVNVTGWLRSDTGIGITDEKVEEFKTQTDTNGLFQFTGLHGARFGQKVGKDGYEMRDEGYISQAGSKTSPNDRAIFMMWKLRGAEPMSYAQTYSFVPWDGSFKRFDLYKSQTDEAWNHHPLGTNGELMVKVTRGIAFTNNGIQEFNWTATLEITNGGLLAFNDPYPYIAPTEGYQTSVTLDGPTNFVDWGNGLRQGFYFKSKGGQVYGRMVIRMSAGRNYAGFDAEIYANPNDSRNLEFDYNKEIRVR